MDYDFRAIEAKWQRAWKDSDAYKVTEDTSKPKYYVLDMFPYPSGAGLHVGHPLGYIASDVYARYKRHKGFNVLHPMGYDSFGLPAEQYAIQTGQHPAITTEQNIARYRDQLEQLGFCFDWSREVRTSDPSYYKWTQWIFGELFESWYDTEAQKARPIAELVEAFAQNGNFNVHAACDETLVEGPELPPFWGAFRRNLHGHRLGQHVRAGTRRGPHGLPNRLPRGQRGQLVPCPRHGARQRRGQGWPV